MSYLFTAKPVERINGPIVALYNGAAQQFGIFEPEWTLKILSDDVVCVLEDRLVDAGYCLDANDDVPAGACYGVPIFPPWAGAVQITVKR